MNTKAERVSAARHARGWTQDDLAHRSGVQKYCISKIECGKSTRPRCIDRLATALGVSEAWLEYGDLQEVKPALSPEGYELALVLNRLSAAERAPFRAYFDRWAMQGAMNAPGSRHAKHELESHVNPSTGTRR